MITEGQIILFKFSYTNQKLEKLRPALVLRKLPNKFDDWLICMISSKLHNFVEGLDELISPNNKDFKSSGLKVSSVFRVSRLAIVDESILLGKLGEIDNERLSRLRKNLCEWIEGKPKPVN